DRHEDLRHRESHHQRCLRHGRARQPHVHEPAGRQLHDVEHVLRDHPRPRGAGDLVELPAQPAGGPGMTAVQAPVEVTPSAAQKGGPVGVRTHRALAAVPTWILWAVVLLWTIPTLGLLINSFRPAKEQFTSGWWNIFTSPSFTLENYRRALVDPPGGYIPFWRALLNSFAIAIPGTVIPILMAAAAAYAFAWIPFKGRSWLFITVVGLMAIP